LAPPQGPGQAAYVEALLERGRRARPIGVTGGLLKAQPLDVDRECGQDVLDVRLGQAAVATSASSMAVHELLDGALGPGAQPVEPAPVRILLVSPILGLKFVQAAGREVQAAKRARGARGLFGAAAALAGIESDHHRGRLRHRQIPPVAADLPVGASDLASVEVDDEVLPAEAVLGPVLWAGVSGSGPIRVTRCRRAVASMPATEV